jgi:beta-glucanase (GH16 family)
MKSAVRYRGRNPAEPGQSRAGYSGEHKGSARLSGLSVTAIATVATVVVAAVSLWGTGTFAAGKKVLPASRPPAAAPAVSTTGRSPGKTEKSPGKTKRSPGKTRPSPRKTARSAGKHAVRSAPPEPAGLNPAGRSVFQSDFSGSQLDTSVWGTCYPWLNSAAGCTNFGNTEYQWYLPSQDRVSGGVLQLAAQRVATQGQDANGAAKEYSCRSGMVTTYPSFSFEYGYVQIVAQIPAESGSWPALWLAAANLSWPPEIDILEHWSPPARTRVGLHPAGAAYDSSFWSMPTTPGISNGWHTFGLSWTAGKLTWFIDGHAVLSVTKNIPHQSMYLIANLAQSSVPTAGQCSSSMLIRSVKVWQP